MAGILRPLRKSVLSQQSLYVVGALQVRQVIQPHQPILPSSSYLEKTGIQSRNYAGEMRKSAIEGNVLRRLRSEIQYELDSFPPQQLETEFNGFVVDKRPGEQWIRLEKQFGQNEDVKVEVTMFDGSAPVEDPGGSKSAQIGEEEMLHVTLVVSIFKTGHEKVLELICSAWPDAVEIDNIYMRDRGRMPNKPYKGPPFKDLDDKLQVSLYEFLEVRGIDDTLCSFLHKYVIFKEQSEYLRWLRTVKSFVEQEVV